MSTSSTARSRVVPLLGLVLLASLAEAGPVGAQAVSFAPRAERRGVPAPADTAGLFDRGDWMLAGGLVVGEVALVALDDRIQRVVRDARSTLTDDLDSVFEPGGRTGLWLSVSAATYAVGKVAGGERMADLGLHTAMALAAANVVTSTLKGVAGRWRPTVPDVVGTDTTFLVHDADDWRLFAGIREGGRRQSFPSGHATAAFTVATVLTEEVGGGIGWVVYPLAAGVAWSRLNRDVHWASDVVMGALVGIASGRLVVRHEHGSGRWLERSLLIERGPDGSGLRMGMRFRSR